MIHCPEFARRMALSAGCPDEDIDALWSRHVELVDADPGERGPEYGGGRWKGLVEVHVKKPKLQTVRGDDPVMRAARRAEREAKALEDSEYLKHAVSLEDYIAELRARDDFFEPMTPAERALTTFRDRLPREGAAEWLMAALASMRPEDARRAHPCGRQGCTREAMSWVSDGRIYHGSRCEPCQALETSERKAAG